MNSKQANTLAEIRKKPTPCSILWSDIESLFEALEATIVEGKGSHVNVHLNGVTAGFVRPHPGKEAKRYAVRKAKEFLERAGVIK